MPSYIEHLGKIGFLVFLTVLLTGVVLVGYEGALFLLLLLSLVPLLGKPRKLLLIYWSWVLITPTIKIFFATTILKQTEYLIAWLLFGILAANYILQPKRIEGTSIISRFVLLFLLVVGLSALVNKVGVTPLVHFLSCYAKPFAMFYFTLYFFKDSLCRQTFIALIAAALLQIVLNALAYADLNALPKLLHREFVDYSVGTFAACNDVAAYMVAAIIMATAALTLSRGAANTCLYIALITLAAAQLYLAFSFHITVLFVPTFLLLLIRLLPSMKGKSFLIPLLVISACAAFCVIIIYGTHVENEVTPFDLSSSTGWEQAWSIVSDGLKGLAYKRVFFLSWTFLDYPLLGGGPANFASPLGYVYMAPLTLQYMADQFLTVDFLTQLSATSVLGGMYTGFNSLWGDTGPIGFAAFWGAHVYAGVRILKNLRQELYTDFHQRILAETAFPLIVFFIMLNTLAEPNMYAHLNVGLWILIAVVWNPVKSRETTTPVPAQTSDHL